MFSNKLAAKLVGFKVWKIALASLKKGETVLDLGSGGGIDVFLAAKKVGPKGKVIGVDTSEAMLERASSNAAKNGYKNVEFRLGEIEKLPVDDGGCGCDHQQLRYQPLNR